jgi:triacylglycerol esterase/lipase EstA (alpha/beta hydrolase family)
MTLSHPHPPFHRCENPLLLLHGFLATPHAVSGLAARLSRAGYCTYLVDLGGLFGRFNALPIEDVARAVAARVERLLRDHRLQHIDVLGHSKGGLIGRYYIQKLGGATRVRHLVTLGTPHRGTPWAYSGYALRHILPSLSQMAPGSGLLAELADATFPRTVRLTSIYSKRDALCPPASCRLEIGLGGHLRNVEVSDGGHLEFLFRKRFASIVESELASVQPSIGRAVAPGGAQRPTSRRRRSDRDLVAAGQQELAAVPA